MSTAVSTSYRDPGSFRDSLRVRLVTWDDDPPVGGQGVYARELRSALTEHGLRVSTVAGRGPFAMRYPRLTNRPHLDMTFALNCSTHALTDGSPDIVHVSGGPGGLQLLRRLGVPVVFTAHHTFRQSHSRLRLRRAYGLLEAKSYGRATAVAAVSPSTAASVVEMGVPPEKVVVISPGVRIDREGVSGGEREAGRMLFVGRLEPEKGPLDAVRAMDEAAQRVPGALGYVVGSGSMREQIRKATDRTSGRVRYLGRLTDAEVARQYRQAEVVLVPSDFEGLGLVALEAMAAGAAVAGYRVTGLCDSVGVLGALVAHRDVGALAAATVRLLTERTRREETVARSLDALQNERSWSRCAVEFEQLYRRVLDG